MSIELAKFWILIGRVDKISPFRIAIKRNFRTNRTKGKENTKNFVIIPFSIEREIFHFPGGEKVCVS